MSYRFIFVLFILSSIFPNPNFGADDYCVLDMPAIMECCCGEQEEIEVPGGDFEISPFPAPGGWIDYTTGFGPWIVSTGSISHHDDGHNNLGAGNPNPSTAHLDLNGFSVGGVCQTMSGFTIGQECTIVFYYAIHNAVSSADASLQIDGGAALDIFWSASNVGSNIWLEASYTFTATDTDMEICFESESFVNCCGMLIDDISMFCCQPDQEDPELDEEPDDEIYECLNQVPDPPDVNATDDCSEDMEVLYDEDIDDNDPCYYTIVREWTTEDECGNTDSHTQFIEVIDSESPEVLSRPDDLTISCNEDIESAYNAWVENFGGAEIYDVCEEIFVMAFNDDIPIDTCSQTFVTFVFLDACGNFVEDEAYVYVLDEDEPVFDIPAMDILIPCSMNQDSTINAWLLNNGYSESSDNCQFIVFNDFSGVYDSTQLVNFSAVDFCGNSALTSAMLIITNDIDTIHIDTTTCDPELAGIQEIFIDNSNECDSLLILNFNLLQSDTNSITSFTCDPQEALIDTFFLTNANGCDSISYIEIILRPRDTTRIDLATCDENGVGADTLVLQNMFSCDSLVIISSYLTLNDTLVNTFFSCAIEQEEMTTTVIPGTICDTIIIDLTIPLQNDFIEVDAFSCKFSEVGMDTIVETNMLGCDSVIVTNTLYAPIDPLTIIKESCLESEISIDTNYIFSGICDSIIITETIPLPKDYNEINLSSCKLENTGVDTSIFMNIYGCDSTVVTNTMYDPPTPTVMSNETCIQSEVGTDTTYNYTGICDSIHITNTVLLDDSKSIINLIICDAVIPSNDTLILQNEQGCDSLIITRYFNDPMSFEAKLAFVPCNEYFTGIIEITNLTGGSPPFLYTIDGSTFTPSYVFYIDAGEYNVQVKDANGCISEADTINFTPTSEIEIQLPQQLILTNGQEGEILIEFNIEPDTFYWSAPEVLSCTQCLNPVISTNEPMTLTLFAVNEDGCITSRSIDILVEENRVYIPNIFSPNGDGVNDEFKIFTSDNNSIVRAMRIYNRWGNLLFEKEDFQISEDVYWNGYYNNEPLNPDVFVYYFELELNNGEQLIFVGDVTLIR